MLSINKRFCVIDGWIVDIKNQQVVSPNKARELLTDNEQIKAAAGGGLKKFSEIDPTTTVLVKSSSKELFRYIKTDDVDFVILPGRVVKKNSWGHKKACQKIMHQFTLNCHTFTLPSRHKCYLYLETQDKDTHSKSSMIGIPVKPKLKGASVFTNTIKVQTFNFTKDDYRILMDLVLKNDSHAKYIAGDMMKILKTTASKEAVGLCEGSIHYGADKLIKDLLPETLAIYGSRISYLLLVLRCCDKLSVFATHRSTANRVARIFRKCHTATDLADAIGKEVSVVSEGRGDTNFWMTWIFLGAFDFCSWENYDHVCSYVSIFNYKQLLESLMWVFRCGGIIHGEDKQAVVERWSSAGISSVKFINDIKKLHIQVSEEAENTALILTNIKHEVGYASLENMLSSYKIIGDALNDITNTFDHHLEELSQWVTFGDFNQLHSVTLASHSKSFEDDASAFSIMDNFRKSAFHNIEMSWRGRGYGNEDPILNRVKDLIADLNKLMMLMVWISTGMPMRYPELATLTYAGPFRNVYIDPGMRRLYLNINYNNNQDITKRTLFLTDEVSKRLWWTIAILRPFAFVTFNDEMAMYDGNGPIDEFCRDVFDDIRNRDLVTEDEDRINGIMSANNEFMRQAREDIGPDSDMEALEMFAFVDIRNHRLFNSSQARSVLRITKQRTKPSHQNMSDLWSNYILPKLDLDVKSSITEDGNSASRTGVVSKASEDCELTFSEMSTAHTLFQEAIEAPVGKRKGSKDSNHS